MDARADTAPPLVRHGDNRDGLRASNLGKSFRGRPVVKDVCLHLCRGEIAGLLGPNGAGKTTCFYMITGLITADAGRCSIDSADVTTQPMYQRARIGVGYLPQENSIFRGMNVWENVMTVVELTQERQPRRKTVTELLEELHIEQLATRPPCRFRAANGAASRSPGRWRRGPTSCCWTSRSPASTRWPSRHSRPDPLPQGQRARHPDHRPPRPRNPRHHRPRIDHSRGRGAVRRHSHGGALQRGCPPRLPRSKVRDAVTACPKSMCC